MSDATPYATDWETKVAFMRDRGIASAKWEVVRDPSGQWPPRLVEVMTDVTLGPAVFPPTEEEKIRETQPSISPQEQERRERQRRRDLVARSSGGPVPRLDDP